MKQYLDNMLRFGAGVIGLVVIAAATAAPAVGQYAIGWLTVDGGGVTAALGGTYALGGTIGQPDAGGVMIGGGYAMRGGFWVGGGTVVGVVEDPGHPDERPLAFRLYAAAPNPLVHSASIRFDLPLPRIVHLAIYDAAGRRVKTVAEGWFEARRHRWTWNGDDDGGRRVAAGIYFVRLDAGTFRDWQKMVVLGQQ